MKWKLLYVYIYMYNRDLDEDVGGVENQMDTHMEREEDNWFMQRTILGVYFAVLNQDYQEVKSR